jgi:hypothetical protein
MHGIDVRFGINRDRSDIQLLASSNDADGDFSPISDQDLFKHAVGLSDIRG